MMWKFDLFAERNAAIDDEGNSITYAELQKFSDLLKEECGRTLAFILCENSIGSLAGYVAMINAQIVPIMLAADLDIEMCNSLLGTYEPEFLWVPTNRVLEFHQYSKVFEKYGYCLLKMDNSVKTLLYPDLALLLTTSGSTGSPKLVRQSYQNIKSNTESIIEYLELDQTERPITTLPMNYTYGLSIINTHLYVGATILLTSKTLMQKEFWKFFKDEKATSFGGVPYTYEILKKLKFSRMELPSLRTMTQAGGKLTPELHKEFAELALERNQKFIVMYGQTEATARMAYLPSHKAIEKCGSMGIPIPGGRFSLIDAEGKTIENADVVGELVYEGENVTLGYAECKKDLQKGDMRSGRLVTGDMAKRDKDGFYYIVGRKKRFLKMYGKRVNLDEIERMVKAKFSGVDCATAGIDDHMYIFVADKFCVNAVKKYIVEATHLNAIGINVQYISGIPKNDAGKILYKELENYYERN